MISQYLIAIWIRVILRDCGLGCACSGLRLGTLPHLLFVLALVQLGPFVPGHMQHVQVGLKDRLQAACTTMGQQNVW